MVAKKPNTTDSAHIYLLLNYFFGGITVLGGHFILATFQGLEMGFLYLLVAKI